MLLDKSQELKASLSAQSDKMEPNASPFLYCLNLVYNQKNAAVRRGAVVKAMAICTRHQFIQIFKVFLLISHTAYHHPCLTEILHKPYRRRVKGVV